MSWMLKEIEQQPGVFKKTVEKNTARVGRICEEIRRRDVRFIMIAARGTSDNAAVLGKYIFGYLNGIPVGLAAPSLLTLYRRKLNLKHSLVIGISQSGESPDVVEVLRRAGRQGAYTVGITNEKGSKLTRHAHAALYSYAGKERSIPATKTYTGQLALLYLLSLSLAQKGKELERLREVPALMSKALEQEMHIAQHVEALTPRMEECMVLGRGLNYATALETALKIKETCYLKAEALSGADFMHGPVAVIDRGFPVILFAPPDATFASMCQTARRLRQRQAERIIVSSDRRALKLATFPVEMPRVGNLFTPVVYVIAGQLFAYFLSRAKGHDPDKPRGLSKITRTK